MLEAPRGPIANADQAYQFQRRYVILRLGEKIHPLKPLCQRQFTRMKNGPTRERGLVPTSVALDGLRLAMPDHVMPLAHAHGTFKTIAPTALFQRIFALRLCSVELHEPSQAQPRLKLHPIHFPHDQLQAAPCTPYGSWTVGGDARSVKLKVSASRHQVCQLRKERINLVYAAAP
jgi:hypothetical protein